MKYQVCGLLDWTDGEQPLVVFQIYTSPIQSVTPNS